MPGPVRRRLISLRDVHCDERGAVSLETILLIGAIAVPVLVFFLKFGWPKVRDMLDDRQKMLEIEADRTINNG